MPENPKPTSGLKHKCRNRRQREPKPASSRFDLPPQNTIILDSIADGVFTVDHEWRITIFNRAHSCLWRHYASSSRHWPDALP